MLNSSIRIVMVAALATWLSLTRSRPRRRATATPSKTCKIEDTNLLSSTVVPAADDLPEYCRVLGYVRPAINFEIRLPTTTWNGKFYMAGCGAQCGKVLADRPGFNNAMNHGLRRNYAAVDNGRRPLGLEPSGIDAGPTSRTRSPALTSSSAR